MELEHLCQIPALSGDEYELHDYLEKEYQQQGLHIVKDKLGSVFGEKRVEDASFKVMLSANMDENGAIIDDIDASGLLHFVAVGIYAEKEFLHQRVCVLSRHHDRYYGHVIEKNHTYWIDAGFLSEEDAKKHIKVGDTVVLEIPSIQQDGKFLSKNVNNRAGLYVANEVMKEVGNLAYTLSIGGITQSVVGQRGAITATNAVRPDVAIVLDVAYVQNYQPNTVYIRYFDKTLLPNSKLVERMKSVAHQLEYTVEGQVQQLGTDGSFIHKSLEGTPTVVLVIPLQSPSTFIQLLQLDDLKPLIHTLMVFLQQLHETDVRQISFQEM